MESVEQISDGSTLQVHVPKKRVFISAPNVKNKAVKHGDHGDIMGIPWGYTRNIIDTMNNDNVTNTKWYVHRTLMGYDDTKRYLRKFYQLWGCNQQKWWYDGDIRGGIQPTDREKGTPQ